MFFVMRVLQGIGSGMMLGLVPLYLTEVAPPKHRGLLAGSTQFAGGFGYILYVCDAGRASSLMGVAADDIYLDLAVLWLRWAVTILKTLC